RLSWPAIVGTTPSSMPYSRFPPRASPLSLSRIRLYFGVRSPISASAAAGYRGGNALVAIGALAIGLANVEPGEPAHHDVLLELRDVLRDQVLDRVLGLPKVWLLQQDCLLDEVLDLPVHTLGEGLRRGAVQLGLAQVARALLDKYLVRDIVAGGPTRAGGGGLEGGV